MLCEQNRFIRSELTTEAVVLLSRETNPRTVEVGMEAETREGKRVNYTGKA